jgi:hypothetical protein
MFLFLSCFVYVFQVAAADPAMNLVRGQPNVEAALNTQPDTVQQELRKPTIGGRKPQAKRSGVWRLLVEKPMKSPPPHSLLDLSNIADAIFDGH